MAGGRTRLLRALALAGAALCAPADAQAHATERHAPPASVERLFPRTDAFDFEAPRPGTYALPPLKRAPDAEVLDPSGRSLRVHEAMGDRVVLLSFVYLQCTDACPLATGVLLAIRAATRHDPELRDNLRLLTVSFDPRHDTPEVVARYAAGLSLDTDGCPWRFFAAPSEPAAERMLAAYGQPARRRPTDAAGESEIAHLLRVYLIDRAGRIRNIYGLGFLDPRLLIADVRTLLLEERRGGS